MTQILGSQAAAQQAIEQMQSDIAALQSPPQAGRYDPLTSIYWPPGDDTWLKARQAFARARCGGQPVRAGIRGDSTTEGVISGLNPGALPHTTYVFYERALQILNASGAIGRVEESIMQFSNADDPRFTYAGGGSASLTANTQTMTFADAGVHDAYDLVILRGGNAASVVVSGTEVVGSPLTVSLAGIVNNSAGTIRIPMSSAAAHTFTITGPPSGTAQITNLEPVLTTSPPILKLGGVGVSGQTLRIVNPQVTGSGSSMAPLLRPLPDVQGLFMGINDMKAVITGNFAPAAAVYKADVIAYVTAFQAQGTDVYIIVPPSYNSNATTPSATESLLFQQALYQVADQYKVPLIDLQRRWGTGVAPTTGQGTTPSLTLNAGAAQAMYDGTHPTIVGYADIGMCQAHLFRLAA